MGPRLQGLAAATMCLAWVLVALYSLHASIPSTVISLPGQHRDAVRTLLPQGWHFFTRDAREADLSVIALRDGGWERVALGPNGQPEHLFGISRAPRAQLLELGALQSQLPAGGWHDCTEAPTDCVAGIDDVHRVPNDSQRQTLCGALAFVLQDPVPWAWASQGAQIQMSSRIVRVDAQC